MVGELKGSVVAAKSTTPWIIQRGDCGGLSCTGSAHAGQSEAGCAAAAMVGAMAETGPPLNPVTLRNGYSQWESARRT